MYIKILTAVALAVCICCSATAAESDQQAFKERIAACKTEKCSMAAAHLYVGLSQKIEEYRRLDGTDEKIRWAKEMVRMRAQLHDHDYFLMLEDGRWEIMSEVQKQEWMDRRWGPR